MIFDKFTLFLSALEVELTLSWFGDRSKRLPRKRALREYYAHIKGRTDGRILSMVGGKHLREGGRVKIGPY